MKPALMDRRIPKTHLPSFSYETLPQERKLIPLREMLSEEFRNRYHAMVKGIGIHDVLVRFIYHMHPEFVIPKFLHHDIDIGEISIERQIVFVGSQDTIKPPRKHNLTSLGPYGLEMAG